MIKQHYKLTMQTSKQLKNNKTQYVEHQKATLLQVQVIIN